VADPSSEVLVAFNQNIHIVEGDGGRRSSYFDTSVARPYASSSSTSSAKTCTINEHVFQGRSRSSERDGGIT
jgi:hypothetical protein